jgi:carotenoid cleavage dioxygenase
MNDQPLPFWLQGNFAPVTREVTAHELPVTGELPRELAGTYLRNGPNPRGGASPHWLVGDGMLHGVALAEGRARWYRNRYVGAPAEPRAPGAPRDLRRGRNNTHVIAHGGRVLALVEAMLPQEIGRDLATIGAFDFGGAIETAVTAHPKRCPTTGELHFFGYQLAAPHLVYYVADAQGRVTHRQAIEGCGPSYLHDFAITARHAIFFDTPVRMVAEWGAAPMPFRWDPEHRARIAVVPRGGGAVRWFDVAPCMVSHAANAYEEGGTITIDAVTMRAFDVPPPELHRWRLDLATGEVREETLDDHFVDFPRVDERRVGLRHRYTYTVELRLTDGKPTGSLLRRHDGVTGASRACDLGPAQMPGECVMVPRGPDARDDDDGWLLTFVYDAARGGSDLVVLDARELAPVARVALPQRVPFGFHGSWLPAGSAGIVE